MLRCSDRPLCTNKQAAAYLFLCSRHLINWSQFYQMTTCLFVMKSYSQGLSLINSKERERVCVCVAAGMTHFLHHFLFTFDLQQSLHPHAMLHRLLRLASTGLRRPHAAGGAPVHPCAHVLEHDKHLVHTRRVARQLRDLQGSEGRGQMGVALFTGCQRPASETKSQGRLNSLVEPEICAWATT